MKISATLLFVRLLFYNDITGYHSFARGIVIREIWIIAESMWHDYQCDSWIFDRVFWINELTFPWSAHHRPCRVLSSPISAVVTWSGRFVGRFAVAIARISGNEGRREAHFGNRTMILYKLWHARVRATTT